MTTEEFNERFGKYAVKFSSYYKYTFNFRAEVEPGVVVTVGYGGNHDDIYRYEVDSETMEQIDCAENWTSVTVYENGVQIFDYYNY